MAINLADHENTPRFKGDYDAALADLQQRLAKVQVAHIIHKRRSVILFEGWDAAGKGGIIKRMTADWDPRYYQVHPIAAPTEEERDHHFLWRFATRLPSGRNISVFDRSWYGRVLVERVEDFCSKKEWKRAYDDINAFERQQIEAGSHIVKLFVHITQETQDKQLAERLDTPWKRWKTGADDSWLSRVYRLWVAAVMGPGPAGLGGIHGRIGVPQQIAGVGAVVGIERAADAQRCDGAFAAGQHDRLLHARKEAADEDGDILPRDVRRQDQREFVAAQPESLVAGPQHGAQPRGDHDQHRVARIMAVPVVDLLEPVHVDIDGGKGAAIGIGPRHDAGQDLLEHHAVAQARQRVAGSLLFQHPVFGQQARMPVIQLIQQCVEVAA